MDTTLIFFLIAVGLAVWALVLTIILFSLKRKNSLFFETDKGNIYELLVASINQNKKLESRSAAIEKELVEIAKVLKDSFQKFAMVRYNPFKDTGGNQSFSLAILDLNNNGFVITSIHGREVNRVYAKPVEKGKSSHNLSAEEEEVLALAVNK